MTYQTLEIYKRCTDVTFASVSLYRSWEAMGTMGDHYLSEKQILGCGQSSWTGPPLPTRLALVAQELGLQGAWLVLV